MCKSVYLLLVVIVASSQGPWSLLIIIRNDNAMKKRLLTFCIFEGLNREVGRGIGLRGLKRGIKR